MAEYSFVPNRDGIVRETLGYQIATAVARDVLAGKLRPGESVTQDRLAAQFKASRMPVRDALRELAAAGYVVPGPGNQLHVATFTRTDIDDLLELEANLAALMARRATERADDDVLLELDELHGLMLAAARRSDGYAMSELNYQFHTKLYEASCSTRLVAAHRACTLHVGWRFYAEHPDWMSRGNAEHGRMLEAIKSKDAAGAQRLVFEHVRRAELSTVPLLEQSSLSRPTGTTSSK